MTQTANYTYTEEASLPIFSEAYVSGEPTLSYSNTFSENRLFSTVTPLFYREKLRITFEVSENFKNKMAMIRGIVEFNRSSRFLFRYNLKKRTIETDIHPASVGELNSFFDTVLKITEDEIRFKKVLKDVIAFEKEYKRLSTNVYAVLNSTATGV
jgi:hypothetical protein